MKPTMLPLALLATCSLALPASAAPNFKQRKVTDQSPINTAGNTNCKLTYQSGGKVMQNVNIVGVYWTSAAATQQKQLDAFYASVVQTSYFDWLREYNTTGPTQAIGRGSYLTSYVDASPPTPQTAGQLDDSEIGPWLDGLITAKKLPKPDNNTIYICNFPPNLVITSGSDSSCNGGGAFCAYHAGFSGTNGIFRYAVMPDLQPCGGGCGGTADPLKSVTVTTSHELIEAVTDPDGWNNSLAWYDQNNSCNPTGEIGDICNGKAGTAGTNAVQLEWSNTYKACIASDTMNKIPGSAVADFSLALDNMSVTANIGGTGAAKVTSTPVGTATAMLNLTVTGLPMGVTAAFAPSSVMTNASSMVTFTVPAGTMVGMYPFTITGNTALPDNVIHSVTGTLNVQNPPPPDMAMPIMDMAQPVSTGGNGGTGGGGSGGNGGGTGGNGQNGGNGFTGGNNSSGCSVGGSPAASGAWILGLLCVSLFLVRRRRA